MARAARDTRSFRSIPFGGKTVFGCECCGRQTRMSTQDDDRYCAECYELLGIQNGLWDDGVDLFKSWGGIKTRDDLVTKIEKRKGDTARVRAYMPDLFAVTA
jgi:hypothetical protein